MNDEELPIDTSPLTPEQEAALERAFPGLLGPPRPAEHGPRCECCGKKAEVAHLSGRCHPGGPVTLEHRLADGYYVVRCHTCERIIIGFKPDSLVRPESLPK